MAYSVLGSAGCDISAGDGVFGVDVEAVFGFEDVDVAHRFGIGRQADTFGRTFVEGG